MKTKIFNLSDNEINVIEFENKYEAIMFIEKNKHENISEDVLLKAIDEAIETSNNLMIFDLKLPDDKKDFLDKKIKNKEEFTVHWNLYNTPFEFMGKKEKDKYSVRAAAVLDDGSFFKFYEIVFVNHNLYLLEYEDMII